jgi:hypothetical protein
VVLLQKRFAAYDKLLHTCKEHPSLYFYTTAKLYEEVSNV